MMKNTWTIAPLILGTAVRDKSQTLLYRDYGVPLAGALLAWLLVNGDERVLVDAGAFGRVERPEVANRYDQTPEQRMEPQLKRFNTSCDQIRLVINTHLHLDHAGGNDYFPKATFVVQKKEMEYAQNPLPIHRGAYDVDFSNMTFEYADGDAEILPGIRVVFTPGHSPGGQSVLVDTEKGLHIIAGDTITHFINMEVPPGTSFWPNGIYVDLRDCYWSLDRLRDLGGFILPGHDTLVMKKELYP
ncbi:MAG TPA: N-acyl homoserine lactonase family protein [Syntrophorhabdaceae bacterium]|nr:N-acyl homoserine lactonase family protein [Syntrophorhabdaceae bacterium]